MNHLLPVLEQLAQIAIIVFFTYCLFWVIIGKNVIKSNPGETLARLIIGTVKGLWHAIVFSVTLTVGFSSTLAHATGARKPKISGIHGTGTFLTGPHKVKLLNRFHKGLVIDGKRSISEDLSYRHVSMVKSSGGGKTTGYIIPNVLKLDHSMVITDPSGEIWNLTSGFLNQKGFTLKVFDLSDPTTSLQYNPLYRATDTTSIGMVAKALIEAAYPPGSTKDPFWPDSAEQLSSILIKCLKQGPEQYQNLRNLKRLIENFGTDGKRIKPFILNTASDEVFDEYVAFLEGNPEKTRLNILSSARTALKPLSDDNIAKLTAKETLFFEEIRQQKTVLYIIVPETRIRYYSFLLRLLYGQIFDFCKTRQDDTHLPIYFLLDEFGNMGRVPNFEEFITTARKYQCSISILMQDEEQLRTHYGASGASTILNGGCTSKIYLPGVSMRTAKELEQLLGRKSVIIQEKGQRREVGRNLMNASEIIQMPSGSGLFISGNNPAVKLNITPFYDNPRLKRRTHYPPVRPTVETDTELALLPLTSTDHG